MPVNSPIQGPIQSQITPALDIVFRTPAQHQQPGQLLSQSQHVDVQSKVPSSYTSRSVDEMPITSQFRPSVSFQFPKKKIGKYVRSCRSQWFEDFPWPHYEEKKDSLFCFVCVRQNSKNNIFSARNKEDAFITEGFSNWNKAVEKFQEHQSSKCHQTAMDYTFVIPRTCGNVLEMSSTAAKKTMQCNQKCLITIIECLPYLSRQGQPCKAMLKMSLILYSYTEIEGKGQSFPDEMATAKE